MIPLILRLKKAEHREIAKAQDIVVVTLYEVFDDAVIHGGTAIWRCYSGNRFSEDIDAYLERDMKKINRFFELIEKRGFAIVKKKVGENSIFSNLAFGRTMVRFEAVFKKTSSSLKEYETAEGNFITIYTLSPNALVKEKVAAYLSRFKIRDLYDIFFLLRHLDSSSLPREELKKLVGKFKKPVDEQELRVLILEGITPESGKMLAYISERAHHGERKT